LFALAIVSSASFATTAVSDISVIRNMQAIKIFDLINLTSN